LSKRGIGSILLERKGELGGLCSELGCKGVNACVRCDACLATDLVSQVKASPLIERLERTELRSVSGQAGDFHLSVEAAGERRRLGAGAVICAAGGEPFDAILDKRLGYGEIEDVITSLDLERQLSANGRIVVPSTGFAPHSVAFILCVGSRDAKVGASYCSKACCKYSFKLAQAIRAREPECSITFLFMDWRLYDPRENVRAWAAVEKGVTLVRSRPAEVGLDERSKPEVRFATEGDVAIESESFDMVVLALGLRPSSGSKDLAGVLGIEMDVNGFMASGAEPCASSRPGVFLAGTCRGPMEIVECAKDGAEAASKASALMEGFR
jgi:heterodisulfide reductase subunit A